MPAFFIVNVEIPDQEDRKSYDEYVMKVKPIVESYGGEYIVRSELVSAFMGSKKPDRVIIIRFKNREQLEKCFNSPEYTSVKALRENSVRTNAVVVEQ